MKTEFKTFALTSDILILKWDPLELEKIKSLQQEYLNLLARKKGYNLPEGLDPNSAEVIRYAYNISLEMFKVQEEILKMLIPQMEKVIKDYKHQKHNKLGLYLYQYKLDKEIYTYCKKYITLAKKELKSIPKLKEQESIRTQKFMKEHFDCSL